ncbi:hypothetical protein ACFQO4_18540 [Saliphagus sp. GCM10025334]
MSILKTGWDRLKEYDELLLYAFLLLGAAILINDAFSYRHNARIIPLITLVAFVLLLLLKAAFLIAAYTGNDQIHDLIPDAFGGIAKSNTDIANDLMESENKSLNIRIALVSIIWVLLFSMVFYLFGIIYPIPILLLVFLVIHYDAPVTHSIGITALVFGLLYILFVELLNMRVYQGVVFEDLLTLPSFLLIG